ncbi:MAG: sulfite exporter TauE/SafE family protein [Nocardioidaceae bacterium]|nr:sulfite exporter TauE/SafE family protein [Nocardioidaceae bacterium]
MTLLEALAVVVAGLGAGAINAIVGSGTLITFPTLLAVGYPPVLANVSNTVGLVPGSVSGVVGYRRELAGQRSRLVRLGTASLLGGISGAVLLLTLPEAAFDAIVPVLIGLGCLLVLVQPQITARLSPKESAPPHGSVIVWVLVFVAGVYGGYFGAAQGVLLIAILGLGLAETMQRINAAKNTLALLVNGVAAVVFIVVSDIAWVAVGLVAGGSVVGGLLGATVGRRLPPLVFRVLVAVVGLVAIVALVFFD